MFHSATESPKGKSYKISLRLLGHQVNKKSQVTYLTTGDVLISMLRHPVTSYNAQQRLAKAEKLQTKRRPT